MATTPTFNPANWSGFKSIFKAVDAATPRVDIVLVDDEGRFVLARWRSSNLGQTALDFDFVFLMMWIDFTNNAKMSVDKLLVLARAFSNELYPFFYVAPGGTEQQHEDAWRAGLRYYDRATGKVVAGDPAAVAAAEKAAAEAARLKAIAEARAVNRAALASFRNNGLSVRRFGDPVVKEIYDAEIKLVADAVAGDAKAITAVKQILDVAGLGHDKLEEYCKVVLNNSTILRQLHARCALVKEVIGLVLKDADNLDPAILAAVKKHAVEFENLCKAELAAGMQPIPVSTPENSTPPQADYPQTAPPTT